MKKKNRKDYLRLCARPPPPVRFMGMPLDFLHEFRPLSRGPCVETFVVLAPSTSIEACGLSVFSSSPTKGARVSASSSTSSPRMGTSPSLSFSTTFFNLAESRCKRAASWAANTPVSRFVLRKERFTFERVDLAIYSMGCRLFDADE